MKLIKILFVFILIGNTAFGQIDTTNVKNIKHASKFGPNKTHYVHAYFNFMLVTPPAEGTDADLFYGKSHSISYGVRYKLKIADFFALGAGLNYTYNVWHFKQNDTKKIPTSILYDKEKLKVNALGADVFLRFNFGKRKNTIGNYTDIGVYTEWCFSSSRQFTDYINDTSPEGFSDFTGINSNLNYLNNINYGVELRIGYGKVVLFTKYRLSDMFTPEYKSVVSNTELPRLTVGVEVGFHK